MGRLLPPNTLQWGEAENVCSSSPSPPPAPMQLPADCIMNQTLIDTCSQPGEAGWAGGPHRCLQGLGGGCGGLHSGTLTDLPGIGWPQPALWGSSCLSFPLCGTSHVQRAEDLLRAVRGHACAGVCPCVSSGRHKHISRAIKGRKGPWRLLSITCGRAGFLQHSAGLGGRARSQTGMGGCTPVFPSQVVPTPKGVGVSRSDCLEVWNQPVLALKCTGADF